MSIQQYILESPSSCGTGDTHKCVGVAVFFYVKQMFCHTTFQCHYTTSSSFQCYKN